MKDLLTKKELASVAGYSYRQLYNIDRDLPQDKKLFVESEGGKYDLATFVQRWVDYNVNSVSEKTEDLEIVKARHEVIKTRKTELEVQKMEGQLVDVQDIKKLWANIANTVMLNFLRVADKLAPQLQMMDSTDAIKSIINDEIRSVLEHISETPIPDYAEKTDTDDESED